MGWIFWTGTGVAFLTGYGCGWLDLYTIAVMFRGGQRQVNLVYQAKGAAEEAWCAFTSLPDRTRIPITEDDYGSRLGVYHDQRSSIDAVLFQDAGRVQEAGIEMALLNARSQSKAQARAQHDPMIKTQNQIVPGGGFIGRG